MSEPFNLPPGCSLRDIEGQQSDDDDLERELTKGDMMLDLQDGDVDEDPTK